MILWRSSNTSERSHLQIHDGHSLFTSKSIINYLFAYLQSYHKALKCLTMEICLLVLYTLQLTNINLCPWELYYSHLYSLYILYILEYDSLGARVLLNNFINFFNLKIWFLFINLVFMSNKATNSLKIQNDILYEII